METAFSPKNRENCTSQYNHYGTYKPYFEWTSATWIKGQMRNLQWVPREVIYYAKL